MEDDTPVMMVDIVSTVVIPAGGQSRGMLPQHATFMFRRNTAFDLDSGFLYDVLRKRFKIGGDRSTDQSKVKAM